MYAQTCKPFPALGQCPFQRTSWHLLTPGRRGCCGLRVQVQTSAFPLRPQYQLPLLHIDISPPEPSLKLFSALLHSLRLFPPHPLFLVYNCVPESSSMGSSPTCICYPKPAFCRASWPGCTLGVAQYILHMIFPNDWPWASSKLFFLSIAFSLSILNFCVF